MSSAPNTGRRRRLTGADLVTSLLGAGHHPAARRTALIVLGLVAAAAVIAWVSSGHTAARTFADGGGGDAGMLIPGGSSCGPISVPRIAMMFLVRHDAYHSSLWTAWLDSVNGLLPAAAVQEACCGKGRWRQQQRRQQFRRRSARELDASDEPQTSGNWSQPLSGPVSGSGQVLYSVYVHDSANSRTNYAPGEFFYGHRIPTRIVTRWGSSTLTIAFKLLLKEALAEPANQRFVLLDESAVPLYPAAAVYLQLMGETKSRVAACVEPPPTHPERWADNMTDGNFTADHFRESSQWKMLIREHAEIISEDSFILKRFLFRCPLKSRDLCITDEHYDPTVLAFYGVGKETTCNPNSLVEVNWRQYEWEEADGAHPHLYTPAEANARTLALLRTIGFSCQPYLTVRGAEQLGNFVQADSLAGLQCHEPPYVPPFERDWPARARRNMHCHLFSRKWPANTADQVLQAALQMRIVTAPVDLPREDNTSLVQCFRH